MLSPASYALPAFPLEQPVLPGQRVPLVIFEPRYLRLVSDLQDLEPPEFVIAGITRGREVGGGEQRETVGVVAQVLEIRPLGDNQVAVAATALRRVQVDQWLDDDPYPKALVSDWPETFSPDLLATVRLVQEAVSGLYDVARAAMPETELSLPVVDPQQPDRSLWRLLAACGFGPLDTMNLLKISDPVARSIHALELISGQQELLSALGDGDS